MFSRISHVFSLCTAAIVLFSLGMINYNTPILAQLKFAVAISNIKVILQPLVFMVIVAGFLHQSTRVLKPNLILAVGPRGTMVLVFAPPKILTQSHRLRWLFYCS